MCVAPAHTHGNTCILTYTPPCAHIAIPAPDLQEKHAKAFEGFALKSNLSLRLVLLYPPLTETDYERTPPKSTLPANLPLGLPPQEPPTLQQPARREGHDGVTSHQGVMRGPAFFDGISVQSGRMNWKHTLESGNQRRHGRCHVANVGVRWWRWQGGRSERT